MKEVAELASTLQVAVKTLQIYGTAHPRTQDALTALENAATVLLKGKARISLTSSRDVLLADSDPVVPATTQVKALATAFARRQIGGIVLAPGVPRSELVTLTRVLALRPEQVRAAGGAERIFREESVANIRITQVRYEAVMEDEEVAASRRVRRGVVVPTDPDDVSVPQLLQRYLLSRLRPEEGAEVPPGQGTGSGTGTGSGANDGSIGIAPGAGSGAGGTGTGAGASGSGSGASLDGGTRLPGDESTALLGTLAETITNHGEEPPSSARAKELLTQAMSGLDAVAQVAMLISIELLPAGAVRESLRGAAAEVLTDSAAGGESNSGAIAALARALDRSASEDHQLAARMLQLGVTRSQLEDALETVGWDRLQIEEKIADLHSGERIFEVPPARLLNFFRSLIEDGKQNHLQQLVERYVHGLDHPEVRVREEVFSTLGQLVRTTGLSREIEQIIGRSVLNQFVRENDGRLRAAVTEATANFVLALVDTSRCDVALRVIERLDSAASVAPPGAPLHSAVGQLEETIGLPAFAAEILEQIGTADSESLSSAVLPFVSRFGRTLSPQLIEALGTEEDRTRRGRLVRALKAIGSPAFPAILAALREETWFLVRNALNVLADIGTREHVPAVIQALQNHDARVRRAAIRTLGKLGGTEAEKTLLGTLEERNLEALVEAILALAGLHSVAALPDLTEFARGRRAGTDEKVREAAIIALGQIGSDDAVPALTDILKPKGLFSRGSTEMRTNAAKALGTLGSTAAKDVLKAAASGEGDRTLRELIIKLGA